MRPILLLLLLFLAAPAAAQASGERERPRLLVAIVIDQLLPGHLDRLEPWLGDGLGRMIREGRSFRAAQIGYARTETGPGHASFATGRWPNGHGILGNGFIDRPSGEEVYCVGDADAEGIGPSGPLPYGGVSARNQRAPALGDHLRASFPASRTVSIAGKDRSAVCLGGREAEIALFWDRRAGGFMTSSAYAAELPAWVGAWNEGWRAVAGDSRWELPADPGAWAGSGTGPDDREGEGLLGTAVRCFPYVLPSAEAKHLASLVFHTPLLDAFVLSLAREAVDVHELGRDDSPDVLALGLSACDAVGHSFGPTSCEVTSLLIAADERLGELFDFLDETVGEDRWIACLTSDHGVLELPEQLVPQGVPARRVPPAELTAAGDALRAALVERFGASFEAELSADGVLLGRAELEGGAADPAAVRRAVSEWLGSVPWVERAFTFEELAGGANASDPLLRLAARSFAPDRGLDVVLLTRPYRLLGMPTGTNHGSPWPYDREVPLVFLGPGFEPGVSYEPADPVDALPTLLEALDVDPAAELDGRALPRGQ